MLTSKQICELIAKGETVRLECKKATGGLPSSLWSSYCAFANSDGERSGMGLSNIVGTWKKFGFVEPRLNESVDPESVSLVLEVGSSVESGMSSVESSVESGTSSVEILNLLNANPQITLSEVAIRLKLTTRAVEKAVGKLKVDGKVKRIGPKKGGYWVVSSSGAKAFPSPIRHGGKPLTDEEIDAAKKHGRR